MFLRTTKRKNRDGSVVEYHQLAHNVRDPESHTAVAQIIHNFGRADELDREALVRLCRSIARVAGVEVRDALAPPPSAGEDAAGTRATKTAGPWPSDLRWLDSRPLGPVLAIEALWERLGIGPALRQAAAEDGCTGAYERAVLAMTANRLCEPKSKLGVWDRWLPRVHLPSCWELTLDQLYEAMDLLHRHAERVEEKVFFQTADLLNLTVDLVFYDTTTASFAVDFEDPDEDAEGGISQEGVSARSPEDPGKNTKPGLRKRGKSKDGTWNPQIVVALAVTREGLPVRSWVLPGNTTDVTTIEKVKADLRGWKLSRCLFVADGGMDSEENRRLLSLGGGKYLLAVRAGSVKEVKEEVLTRPGRYKKVADNLQVKEVEVGDGVLRRRYFVCFNPREAERQKRHRDDVLAELHEEMGRHKDWAATARWAIELLASKRTGGYLSISPTGQVYVDTLKAKKAEKLDGKWVLITNDDTLKPEDAASGYKGLLVIERCFRSLKTTQIHLTPMHHWLPRRIEAHVKICVLALLIQRVAETTTQKTWGWLRHALSQLQAAECETPTHRFFRRNEPSQDVVDLLKTLAIPLPKPILDLAPLPPKP
jgi:hypothetical protein